MVDSKPEASYVGVTVGFVLGLSLIYGVEMLVEYIEETPEEELFGSAHKGRSDSKDFIKSHPKGFEPADDGENVELSQFIEQQASWEEGDVELASKAIENHSHRSHILEHLNELLGIIKGIEDKSVALANEELMVREQEELAEQIDESIHTLQYKVDHTRRYSNNYSAWFVPFFLFLTLMVIDFCKDLNRQKIHCPVWSLEKEKRISRRISLVCD